jgi:hypothetical protein
MDPNEGIRPAERILFVKAQEVNCADSTGRCTTWSRFTLFYRHIEGIHN